MKLLRSKLFWFAAVVVILCCGMMIWAGVTGTPTILSNAMGAVVTPLENGVSHVTDWFSGLFGYFYRYDDLMAENESLKEQLQEYQKLEVTYRSAISQNTALREAAGIRAKHSDFDLELCSVVSVVGNGFQSTVTLSKGSSSDIEKGDCVITGDGLVGYVSEVGLTYCTVSTVINADFSASALNMRTREVVVAGGSFELAGNGQLKVSYLENDADVRVGDRIVTSGGSYPPDLVIGKVQAFELESHGICSYAAIQPAVDFSTLDNVFVIRDFTVED